MIKNIIFDLGNVLISFKPSEFFDKKSYPEKVKARILSDIFESREWSLLDSAELSTQEAIDSIALHSTLNKEMIIHVFNLRTELLYPIEENIKILPVLKNRGYRLFYLSNFPIDIFDEIRSGYYFFKYFDGGLISAEARVSKPDSRIFRIFLEKYNLIPEESLFIDDIEANVKAAEGTGLRGIVTYGSLEITAKIDDALSLTSS
jgi:putative hydrolase of the HAD superfamily